MHKKGEHRAIPALTSFNQNNYKPISRIL